MKTSTAHKKLKQVERSYRYYQEQIIANPADAEALNKIVALRRYAEHLILSKQITSTPYRSMFYRADLDKIIKKQTLCNPTRQLTCF